MCNVVTVADGCARFGPLLTVPCIAKCPPCGIPPPLIHQHQPPGHQWEARAGSRDQSQASVVVT